MPAYFNVPPENDLEVNQAVPFHLQVDKYFLKTTRKKLALAQFPEEQEDVGDDDWSQGANVGRVKELTDHWLNSYLYDWAKQELMINTSFNHYMVKLDVPGYGELILHFTHAKSPNSGAIPLLFSHGWPGSFMEAVHIVEPLSNPSSQDQPSFDVVAPSIPGFGLSPAPVRSGVGPEVTARAFKILMTDVLGYPRFVTQGGDFGAFITRSIAIQYPEAVIAQHLNMFAVHPPTFPWSPFSYLRWCLSPLLYSQAEYDSLRVRHVFETDQSGYLEEQRTRPQTLGFALGDSPTGLLAWFTEKFHEWVDVKETMTPDLILTMVMMHWIQGVTPGLRFYREAFGAKREAEKTFEAYVKVPTGISRFPKEMLLCPKEWAQQVANVQFWREHDFGGHFPSLECPRILVQDLQQFFRDQVPKSS